MSKRTDPCAPHHHPLCCWPECFQPASDLPLCEAHRREAGLSWVRDHLDLIRTAVAGNLDDLDALVDRRRAAATAQGRRPIPDGSVVYYVLLGDRIKIGTTINLRDRLRSLRLDDRAVLATEPGGQDLERRRHLQFATERQGRREDFAISARLMDHVRSLP